jgi:hypothetical protein
VVSGVPYFWLTQLAAGGDDCLSPERHVVGLHGRGAQQFRRRLCKAAFNDVIKHAGLGLLRVGRGFGDDVVKP